MHNPTDIIRLTPDQLDGIACIRCSATDAPMIPAGTGEYGQLFECSIHTADETAEALAEVAARLTDLEVRVAYTSGYLSAVTMLTEQLEAAGVDTSTLEEYRASLLTVEEREEIAHAVKMVILRRRGETIREHVAFELAMRAGMLCGVELAMTFGGESAAEAARSVALERMSDSEVSAMVTTVEDILVSRENAAPAAATDPS